MTVDVDTPPFWRGLRALFGTTTWREEFYEARPASTWTTVQIEKTKRPRPLTWRAPRHIAGAPK